MSAQQMPSQGQTWSHKKRGTRYLVLGLAQAQIADSAFDEATFVVYVGDDGKWWCRPASEFTDGRFVRDEGEPA